ncbi:glutamate receptor ionotropic, kainate 2-like [Ischnura elegans]|uniref:glutamate receptor ionotropic, kainate 2-like n=1 Tax=Ischnura elegans TaxID=197161 RepID=UPI001ED88810|nr:glutamate receptor ionotropic, kainate 2-like [Ischnura elegans]
MNSSWITIAILGLIAHWSMALPDTVKIGGLFEASEELDMMAFRQSVNKINMDRTILPRTKLVAQPNIVTRHDSFTVADKVCNLLGMKVIGIFGPSSEFTSEDVESICDTMEIPHVETRWDLYQRRGTMLLNLLPYPPAMAKVYVDLVKAWKWKQFTVIYENDDGLVRLSELLKMYDPKGYTVTVRQLDDEDGNYRHVLRKIKRSGETNIVLDCSIDILYEVLKQAQQVGLMASHHNYIITNPDLHTLDLEPFQYGGTNITGVQLIDPADPLVNTTLNEWRDFERAGKGRMDSGYHNITPSTLRMGTALMYDAVQLFGRALHQLDSSQHVAIKPLDCFTQGNWEHGFSLINFMRVSEMKGLSGAIHFDNQGFRTNFVLNIVELTEYGLIQIGTWNSTEGLNLTRSHATDGISMDVGEHMESLQNKTFVVLTALSPPYGYLKHSAAKLSGNDRFEGFGIDLIHEVSLLLGFNYTFKIQHDGVYGSLNRKTGQWNGMIRELMDYRADLAITDLTITYDREGAADFTMPFMNLGISILYKKPTKEPPSLFSFLSPFSREVWMYMLAAYLGVSILLFFMARISPAEWNNPYPCIEEPDTLENQFSLKNSLWFTIGSLMQQGSEIAPIGVSTRMVAGIWWFFTLIMVSSYTANLAAFLTVESMSSPIKSAEDLAKQNVIKYGAKRDGSTAAFFRDSNYSTYQRMWDFMINNPDVFTSSNDEGVNRVKNSNGKYAFLMESTSIEYVVERECDVSQVGGLLDAKGYGIAMRKDSSYRNALSAAVLKLQEVGKLYALKVKWWKEKRGGGACRDDASKGSGAASELGLPNVGGVFVVLIGGVALACIIAWLELIYKVAMNSIKNRTPFWPEIKDEIRFVFKCHGSTKPVRKKDDEKEEKSGAEEEMGEEVAADFIPLSPYATPYGYVKKERMT